VFSRFDTNHACDRRTDGIGVAYMRYSIYVVARKNWRYYWWQQQQQQQQQQLYCNNVFSAILPLFACQDGHLTCKQPDAGVPKVLPW